MSRAVALALAAATALLAGGCARQPAVEVRSIGAPLRGAASDDAMALGRAAFALGNVGIALGQFRQSLRANPASIEALAGIASCYDAMGRADLARRYHEEALALAPANLPLLRLYANSLARHGAVDEAQAVIGEIALRTRASAAQWVIEPAPPTSPTTVPPAPASLEIVALSKRAAQSERIVQAEPAPPVPKARLERLSLGEIALVTTGAPMWPAMMAPGRPHRFRLLNAARRQGLAARNRSILYRAGWRDIAIGDAAQRRAQSLILYPAGQRELARRLAGQLRIAAIRPEPRTDIVILLGRDQG